MLAVRSAPAPTGSAVVALLVVAILVCALAAASSFGLFMLEYRRRRGLTRWMGIPVPMSRGMWIAALVLGLSEGGVVLSIVLLVVVA